MTLIAMMRALPGKSWFGVVVALGLALGCSTTEGEASCPWLHEPGECLEGDDEVGGEGNPPGPCIMIPDGSTRTIHQCTGELEASLSFTALGLSCSEALGDQDACEENHVFGVSHEPYELTKVMACCDPLDPNSSDVDEYVTHCAADMTQQICHTIATRLKQLIDDGELPKTAESTALQTWVAEHEDDCYAALWGGNMAKKTGQVIGSWTIPNKPAWAAVIQDLTVSIDASAITDVALPEDEMDYLECVGIHTNNDQIFEEDAASAGPESEFLLASSASISIVGPIVIGDSVGGSGDFQSLAAGCTDPFCSDLVLTVDTTAAVWTLEDMNLFVEGPTTLGNAVASIVLDRGSVRLYGRSHGEIITDETGSQVHEIPARGAHFVVAGASRVGARLFLLSNSTPITARRSGTAWVFDRFVLDHVDLSGNTWELELSSTTWK